MSFTLHGAGAGGGIAIGQAHLISSARLEVAHYSIAPAQVEQEVMRFSAAVETVRTELQGLRRSVPAGAPAELDAFLNLHLMILDDATLSRTPRELIRSLKCNAEWALVLQMDQLVAQFEKIEDPYLRERKADVVQVVERLLKAMQGQPGRSGGAPEGARDCQITIAVVMPRDVHRVNQEVRRLTAAHGLGEGALVVGIPFNHLDLFALGPRTRPELGAAARKAANLVAGLNQARGQSTADVACRAGEEDHARNLP